MISLSFTTDFNLDIDFFNYTSLPILPLTPITFLKKIPSDNNKFFSFNITYLEL